MREKYWKGILNLCRRVTVYLLTMILTLSGLISQTTPTFVQAAAVDTSKAVKIKQGTTEGGNWVKNSNGKHRYSSYADKKNKALKVDASYGFRIQKTKQTKVTVVKGTACAAPSKYKDRELTLETWLKNYKWFKTANNTANNIQIKISNLKLFQCNADGSNGRWITLDLVRTVTGIAKWKSQNGYVALGTGITDVAYIGISEMTVKSQFYQAGTTTPVTVKTNVSLTDIDACQYVGVKAGNLAGEYVSRDTHLAYMKTSGGFSIYAEKDNKLAENDAWSTAAFIFSGNNFVYKFGRMDKRPGDDSSSWGPTRVQQYVGTGQVMTTFKLSNPVKTVSDSNETNVKQNTVDHLAENWTYSVEQPVPDGTPENFYYDSFAFEDQVESCMKINSVKVEADNANAVTKDVTNMFTITQTGNKVVAKLKNPKNAAFYNNTIYRLKINVKMNIPDDVTEEQLEALKATWKEHGHYSETAKTITMKKRAKTIIDGTNLPSNEVKTIIKGPEKTVSDADETNVVKNTIRDLGSSWTYSVKQKIAQNATEKYKSFVFKDSIESCMKINSVKVKTDNGADVSSWFDIVTAANEVKATLKDPTKDDFYKNAAYSLEINVKMDVPDNVTEEQLETLKTTWKEHGHYSEDQKTIKEDNTAIVEINGINMITNKPETLVELSTTENGDPGLNVKKTVNRYENEVNDTVHYTVKAYNSNKNADTAYFTIKDTSLPDSMVFDFSSIKVSGIDKANYMIEQSGNGWVLKSKGNYALPYGKVITVEYDAKALVASNGTVVDNTASAAAAGIPEKEDTKQVYINSPKVDVEKVAPKQKFKVGDTVPYTVTITNRNPGTFMRDLVLKDLVKTEGLEIKEGTVKVISDGQDITKDLDIKYEEGGKGFTINTAYNLKNADIPCIKIEPYSSLKNLTDKLEVTYDAIITDKAALDGQLDNNFTAPATKNTNGDVIKDDPQIPSGGGEDDEDITIQSPVLAVEKKSDKKQYEVGQTGKYTLKIKQTREGLTAKNVVITDQFVQEKGMKYDQKSMLVKLNGKDVTKDCKVEFTDNSFKITTGKDLSDKDNMEVSYDVFFDEIGEYTNTVVATADNTNMDQATNVVDVKEATPELTINKSSDKKEYAVGNTGKYTLIVNQKNKYATARNVIIKDKFDSNTVDIDADSVKVELNGSDITNDCKIVSNGTYFAIETGKNMTSDDEMKVTYDAVYKKIGTYKNTATTQGDNAKEVSDDNSVKVVKQDVDMRKDADKKQYKVGDMVNYSITVSLKKENSVSKNVVIKDKIPTGLELQTSSIKVTGISDYTIKTSGNKLEVKIPSLKYGEKVIVTYKAKVLKSAEGKTLINKATVNGEGIHDGNSQAKIKVAKTPVTKSNNSVTSPKTGDNANMPLYIAVMIAALAGAVVIFLKRRKLKK